MSDSHNHDTNQRSDFRLNEWHIEPASNPIRRNGESVSLQLLSMQVLVYLSERAGQAVSYDELLSALWPNRVAGEDAAQLWTRKVRLLPPADVRPGGRTGTDRHQRED